MHNPLVSVVIPSYNAAEHIEETVQSVLNQTLTELEVLVMDDGSKDHTKDVVMAIQDERVHYYYKENSGVSDTRNIGMAKAKGKYIALLDSDDRFLPTNLEEKVNFLEENKEYGLVHSNEISFDSDTGEHLEHFQGLAGDILPDLLELSPYNINGPSCVVFPKALFEEIGGFDKTISTSADYDFWLRVASKYPVGLIDKVLVEYRVHANQMSMNTKVTETDMLYVFEKAHRSGLFKSKQYYNKCLSKLYIMLAINYLKIDKNYSQFIRHLMRAVWLYPLNAFSVLGNKQK